MNQIHPMQLPGSHRPVKGKCGAKLIKESSPHLKPINKIPRLIRTATAVIVAGGLAVMVLSAQDDLDTVRQAAEQGDATAQFNLGNMYASGRGVLEDDAEAVRWYRLAAEQGDADAQFYLGVMYASGDGVPEDDAEAVKWYRRAAEQGEKAEAQLSLGFMNYLGEGVPKNNAEAGKWFRLSAEQGLAEAQLGLGILYEQGWGVPEDYVLAYAWYNLASAQGNEQARDIKDDLRTRMTPDQIAQAQETSATLFDRIN